MSTTITEPSLLVADPGLSVNGFPPWFQELQTSAWTEFEALPFPTRKDETWRFSNLKGLTLDRYVAAPESAAEVTSAVRSRALDQSAGRIIFLNDRLVAVELFDASLAGQGIVFTTLEEALTTQADLLRTHFMSQPARLGS